MTKQQLNLRVSDLTRRQLDELTTRWGMNQTEVIAAIVDRVYQNEPEWEVSAYYNNPRHNWKRRFETRDEAIEESLRYSDIVTYVENIKTGEWAKREVDSTNFTWFPPKSDK